MLSISGTAAAGLAVAITALAPAAADEPFAAMDLLWMRPATGPGAPPACTRLLVVNMPRDWAIGDAAVAIFAVEDAERAIEPLVAALMPELAAILEVPSRLAEGCPNGPVEPVAEVLGAVQALRADLGAGLVVAIGVGTAGPTVLAATREAVAARFLGPAGPRLAAAIALGGNGPASYAIGTLPDGQRWTQRGALLCEALASANPQVRVGACLTGLAVDRPVAGAAPRRRR